MPIRLMTDVPNQLVVRRIHHIMQCNGQFNNAQTCSEVAAIHTYGIYYKTAQFVANLLQLYLIQFFQIGRHINPA